MCFFPPHFFPFSRLYPSINIKWGLWSARSVLAREPLPRRQRDPALRQRDTTFTAKIHNSCSSEKSLRLCTPSDRSIFLAASCVWGRLHCCIGKKTSLLQREKSLLHQEGEPTNITVAATWRDKTFAAERFQSTMMGRLHHFGRESCQWAAPPQSSPEAGNDGVYACVCTCVHIYLCVYVCVYVCVCVCARVRVHHHQLPHTTFWLSLGVLTRRS